MPNPSYSNASLRKLITPKDQITDVSQWDANDPAWKGRGNGTDHSIQYPEQSADQLIGDAQDSLGRADALSASAQPTDADHAAALARIRESIIPPTPAENVKGVTDAMKMAGSFGLEGIEKSPKAGPWTKGAAMIGKWAMPSYYPAVTASGVRQMIDPVRSHSVMADPNAGETRLGGLGEAAMGESGNLMSLAGEGVGAIKNSFAAKAAAKAAIEGPADVVRETVSTAQGYKGAGQSTAQASQRAGWPLGRSTEIPYASSQKAVDPNQVLSVAREVAAETGVPVETVLKGYNSAERANPLKSLLRGGSQSRLNRDLGDANSARGAWGGDRSTGTFAGRGGLADVAHETVHPMPGARTHGEIDSLLNSSGIDEAMLPEVAGAGAGTSQIPVELLRKLLGM